MKYGNLTLEEKREILEACGASSACLELIFDAFGYNEEVMEKILYALTGESEFEEEEEE